MKTTNNPFNIKEIREKIFEYKYEILYKNINNIKKNISIKNTNYHSALINAYFKDNSKNENLINAYFEDNLENENYTGTLQEIKITNRYVHNFSLDRTSMEDWRETAVILGLYYLL